MRKLLKKIVLKLHLTKLFFYMKNRILLSNGAVASLNGDFFIRNNAILLNGKSRLQAGESCEIANSTFRVLGEGNTINIQDHVRVYGRNQENFIYIDGHNNALLIENHVTLRHVKIFIKGSNNRIHIGKDCSLTFASIHIEQDYNQVLIHERTTMHGREYKTVQLELDEGTTIEIGEDCMVSNDVIFRTSDSHSIVDKAGRRLNPGKNIRIGKHCWVGMRSVLMKGVELPDHVVIGAGTLLTKSFTQSGVVIAGQPVRIVKKNITWDRTFIPVEEQGVKKEK